MPGPDPEASFLCVMRPALRRAAELALALEGRVLNRPKVGEFRKAKAALTDADTEAQEVLLAPLLGAFHSARLDAEEDTPSVAGFTGTGPDCIVIDPIDGTLHFFLERRGPYAVMAGLAGADRYRAALVALPRERLLFWARRGSGFGRSLGSPETPPSVRKSDAIFVSDTTSEAAVEALRAHGFSPAWACGGAISVAPLVPGVVAGLRYAAPQAGSPSISRRGRIGLLIAREAGAAVTRADGAPFPETLDEPAESLLVASDPATAERVLAALRGIG